MKSTVERRTLLGTMAGGVSFVAKTVRAIVIVPLLLNFWGTEKYGVWLAIFSFAMLMRTIDLGHQRYISNEMNQLYHLDKHKTRVLMGSAVRIAFMIGGIMLLSFCVIWMLGFTETVLGAGELDTAHHVSAGLAILLLMWWITGSMGGVIGKILLPTGLYEKMVYMGTFYSVAEILALSLSAVMRHNILEICLVYASFIIVHAIIFMWYIKVKVPEVYPWWEEGDLKTGWINFKRSLAQTTYTVLEQLNNNGIVVLVGNILGMTVVPIFTTIRTVANIINTNSNFVINPIIPEILRYHARREEGKILQVIKTMWFVNIIVVNIPIIILIPFAEWLYGVWTDGILPFNWGLFAWLVIGASVSSFARAYMTYIISINHNKAIVIMSIVRVVLLFGITIIGYQSWGLIAIGVGVLVSEIVASLVIPLVYIRRILSGILSGRELGDMTLAVLPSIILGVYLSIYLSEYNVEVVSTLACLVFTLMTAVYIWSRLESDVRRRLIGLVARK